MNRLAIVLASLCLFAAPASAQVFGQLHPAHPIRDNSNLWGGYLVLGDRVDNVGLLGQVRFTSSPKFDWGLQFGFADGPGDGAVLLGGDIRPSLKRADSEFPLDLAFDGALGLTIGDNFTLLELQPALLYSHRFPLEAGGAISPYGSVGIDFQNFSYDNPGPGSGGSDTQTDVIARFGAEWEATRSFSVIGEFGVGGDLNGFITGINVLF
jgi:hypothetical protein